MPSAASAPGKVILFGEHAVVFGEPAIAAALNLRTRVKLKKDSAGTINGVPIRLENNPYPYHAMQLTGVAGGALTVSSDIPPGAGLGSSAALSVATLGVLRAEMGNEELAQTAFRVELLAQGRASPLDTSISTHGHAVYVDRDDRDMLWSVTRGEVTWCFHHIDVPQMNLVIGFTGRGAATGPLVENVGRLHSRFEIARTAVSEIGDIAREARRKIREGDIVRLGELMDRNQKLLSIIGVSTPELESLINAVRPHSYGAKLTGAGGGGSIIALTDKPGKVAEAIRVRGFTPFICTLGGEGLIRGE